MISTSAMPRARRFALDRRSPRTRDRLRWRWPTIGDTLFTVCPWWDGPLVKQQHRSAASQSRCRPAKRWIWVHHAPPANSPTSWGGKRFFGDLELVQWIAQYQPSMVISGHVHQSPFIADGSWFDRLGTTWVFNTGLQQAGRLYISCSTSRPEWRSGCRPATSNASTSTRRCSGRPRRSPIRQPGLHPWVGLPIRAWRDLYRRQVDHALQEFADHGR